MNEKVKHKLAESIVNLTKLDLYYEGVGFLMFKIEYPFRCDGFRNYNLKLNLGDTESWTIDFPASFNLFEYLESLFRIKDVKTKEEIRELILDELEIRIRKFRESLFTH